MGACPAPPGPGPAGSQAEGSSEQPRGLLAGCGGGPQAGPGLREQDPRARRILVALHAGAPHRHEVPAGHPPPGPAAAAREPPGHAPAAQEEGLRSAAPH